MPMATSLKGWCLTITHVVLRDDVTNHISNATVPMATKYGRIVTYFEGLLPIKSHSSQVT